MNTKFQATISQELFDEIKQAHLSSGRDRLDFMSELLRKGLEAMSTGAGTHDTSTHRFLFYD